MRIQRFHALCKIVLRDEMVLINLLEQIMQRAKAHARHVPVKVLGKHRCHSSFSNGLIERFRNSGAGICGQSNSSLGHFKFP